MFFLKIVASIILILLFLIGLKKADKNTHNPEYGVFAEYGAGFISTGLAVWGLYSLWL